jgi:alpha-1,6-mannosyltransferase
MFFFFFVLCVAQVFIAPFTKVEESFNVQAMHDMINLHHNNNNNKDFDHLDFPGVVPRTFLGAALVAHPVRLLLPLDLFPFFSSNNNDKLAQLYACRFVLALYSCLALHFMYRSIAARLGSLPANAFALLTCTQFHIIFYASRPLPNTFAFVLVTIANSLLLSLQPLNHWIAVGLVIFCTTVFRCDMVILLFPLAVFVWIDTSPNLSLRGLLVHGIKFAVWGLTWFLGALAITVYHDSWFWQRVLWPEGEVFWFNLGNKSSQWGVSPWHWYFTSALPRALLMGFPLCLLGGLLAVVKQARFLPRHAARVIIPAVAFVGMYSVLPHKELRFLLPVIPAFNLLAALTLANLWSYQHKTRFVVVAGIAAQLAATLLMTKVSAMNYPGGWALVWLNEHAVVNRDKVHLDVYVCMTGVSRFGYKQGVFYDKTEDNQVRLSEFDYLVANLESGGLDGGELIHVEKGEPRVKWWDIDLGGGAGVWRRKKST